MIKLEKDNNLVIKHYNNIKDRLLERISDLKRKGKIIKDKTPYVFGKKCIEILDFLSNDFVLKRIITTSPENLVIAIKIFERKFPKILDKTSTEYIVVYNVFVSSIYEKNEYFNKNEFVKDLDINTCPYCNRNYIYYIASKDGKNINPQIDHFYPKSIYPYLAVSYYNLIPCCQTCNGFGAKEDKDTFREPYKLVNPYLIKENDFILTYFPQKYDYLKIDKSNFKAMEENLEIDFKNKIDSHLNCFHLKEFYKKHKDIVFEMLVLKKYYPKSQIEEFEKLGFKKDEIYRFLFKNYSNNKNFSKRPLSKLTCDIAEELGLINKK